MIPTFTYTAKTFYAMEAQPIIPTFLYKIFSNTLIISRGTILWPARSSDLSRNDFLLWGYIKSKVHGGHERANSLEELRTKMISPSTALEVSITVLDFVFPRRRFWTFVTILFLLFFLRNSIRFMFTEYYYFLLYNSPKENFYFLLLYSSNWKSFQM